MRISEILCEKGSAVECIGPDQTVADAISKMMERNIGSLMVLDAEQRAVGIITERDILRVVNRDASRLEELLIRDYMTSRMIVGRPEADVEEVMGLMTRHRVRHLPIFESSKLVGMISIGDVVKSQLNELAVENECLRQYLYS